MQVKNTGIVTLWTHVTVTLYLMFQGSLTVRDRLPESTVIRFCFEGVDGTKRGKCVNRVRLMVGHGGNTETERKSYTSRSIPHYNRMLPYLF